mgnify:CR=1 FL=1
MRGTCIPAKQPLYHLLYESGGVSVLFDIVIVKDIAALRAEPRRIGGILGLPAALIAFIINYAAYFSEIFRGGIESVPKGQYEAGQVLGMTKGQIFFKVVLLQVVKKITAPMGNEIITLVKDTSLSSVIAIPEILMRAKDFSMQGLIWPLFYSAVFFLAFCGILTLLFSFIEKKLDYYKG